MSGAEAITVLGVIGSIISIVDAAKKVYDAATDAQGLPEAFREVASRLPIVGETLDSAKQSIAERKVNNESCNGVKVTVEDCEEKAKKLKELFQKAIPADGTSDLKRYYKAVKAWGKGSEVEKLMKGMLEDVQLLACERGMKTATKAQQDQIVKAITEVSAISASVPEHEVQETAFTNTNTGSGTQYNAQGENIAQGSARQYISGRGQMTFRQTHLDITQNFSVPQNHNENEAQACLSALFLTDPRDDRAKLISSKGSRVDGTCQWIKSHALYDSWLYSNSQMLWLSGGPGKGKTMLSIYLAEELEQSAHLSQNKLFLQYFCDNKDEKRNTAVAVLRGLIYQLLQSRPELFAHILPTFRTQKQSMFSFETLWRIFDSMVCDPTLGTAYCVLDGLDECNEASLEMLLVKVTTLLSAKTNKSPPCHLNLLITSRELPDFIPEMLSSFPHISLDPDADTEISNDINLFIEVKVKELSEHKQYPRALRLHLEKVFRDRAQGTFLWIGIVAQALRKYKTTEVEDALDVFPPGLDQLYARILLQIDSRQRETAARILRWVVMAVRPLTLSELSIAIENTVKPSVLGLDRNRRIRDQISYCGSLLMIREDKVGLIHQTAKDYLLRKSFESNPELEFFRVKEEVANLEIAKKCLEYLQSGALENSQPNVLRDNRHLCSFPLLRYAGLYWHEHARSLPRLADVFNLSLPFYHKESQIRMSWLKAYWDLGWFRYPISSKLSEAPPTPFKPLPFKLLHFASLFGLLPLMENLLITKNMIEKMKLSYRLNKCDSQGTTALMWACMGGHETVVRLLLEKGANIEAKDQDQQTALLIAAEGGYESVVRLLLEKGANIEAKDGLQQTALSTAAYFGHEAVVRLLLEKGANTEAKDQSGTTALLVAADRGYEAVVRLLLGKGADINAKDKYGESALMKAASSRCGWPKATVQVLLEKRADIKAQDKDGKTALDKAVRVGNEDVVQLLAHYSNSEIYRRLPTA